MTDYVNPFEFEAAANLPPEMVLDVYVEDFNYARFIRSKRNVYLLGERGSGKSMTLLYNSLKFQHLKAKKENAALPLDWVGVYIPCNTPLMYKQEHLLLPDEFHATLVSEHFLVQSILYGIADSLSPFTDLFENENSLKSEIEFIFRTGLPGSTSFLASIKLYAQRELVQFQKLINSSNWSAVYESALNFSSAVLPLLNILKEQPRLHKSHFMLLIDDAHDLNMYQRRALNSWVAYRDHSLFSLKIAEAKVQDPDFHTISGGTILEGHDFIIIDLEQTFQNMTSPFANLAKEIISKRLARANISSSPEEFFPINPKFLEDLVFSETKAREEAQAKYPTGTNKQISDYVYKYGRAGYFRNRSSKANRPPYSGFETIVHISTGVIRNLLDPCYWMYDSEYSRQSQGSIPTVIPPAVQTTVLLERSNRMWERLKEGLDSSIENCTKKQGTQINNLFENLAMLFKERLLRHESEPRAIVFTISGMTAEAEKEIIPLLDIARRAQLLYMRYGTAKDDGRREVYYVPNRMLWPIWGLDPCGQHARVSLKATDIIAAAEGTKFPFVIRADEGQQDFFNDKL